MATDLDILDNVLGVVGPYCGSCPQQSIGEHRVLPDGRGTSGVMLVGDSPWIDEVRQGKPFVGAAGQFLDRHIFRRLGVKRDDFILTNSLWCKPPYLNWTDKGGMDVVYAQEHCRPYLDELIDKVKPKVIIPMGNVALRRICNVSGIQAHQCYVHDTHYGIPAVPTFHPSFVMSDNLKFTPTVLFAFRKALQIAKES